MTIQLAPEIISVTEANFTRAETHLYFSNSMRGGGAGKFHHFREVMSIDNQTVIRANRDTLYSSGVFDLDAGPVTVTLPDAGGRFMSMIAIDEEEYAVETVYAPGQFTYTKDKVGTRYVLLGIRTFVDPSDPKDIEKVHALQDSLRAEQSRTGSFEFPNWDKVSQNKVRADLIKRAASLPDTKGMFGKRGEVDPERHLIGAATGWGGNAPEDALYLTVVPAKNDGKTVHRLTVTGDVPVDGFWSISVYGADGYFHENRQNTYSINNVTAKKAADGSVTIQFGGCDGKTPNCIPITEGWNYWVRLYRPRKEALAGAYQFPDAVPVGESAPVAAALGSDRATTTQTITDQDISDSYIYLLSRLLVLRQQQLDFKEGFKWNELVHREPGHVDWPNPNLDVAYSEAWVAVDEKSCLIVSVPKITGRYYTVQFLNGWGETVANINERIFPERPSGEFAICLEGSQVPVPAGAQRIDVPVKYMRVLLRVALGSTWDEAVALQKQFKFRAIGQPVVPTIPETPIFDIETLLGVEAFEAADLALDSEADINPGMEQLQATARAIARAVKDPATRSRVEQVIRSKAFAEIKRASPMLGDGTIRNGWVLSSTIGVYGKNWLLRTLVNDGGIWANTQQEVIYYKGFVDPTGKPLSGDNAYTLRFPKDQLPAQFATYFWSVIAVDSAHRRVLPNPKKRYLLNKETNPEYGEDGSLTLYFADEKPKDAPDGNWLPTPKGIGYSLTFRFYRPQGAVAQRTYFPPPLAKV